MKKRKGTKSMLRVFLWIAAIIVILMWICFGYHRYRLKKEEKLRQPLGQLIDINGNNISIYAEGSGSKTLVSLSGGGTCSPILDFKSLYSMLSDEYKIVLSKSLDMDIVMLLMKKETYRLYYLKQD